MNIYKYPLYEVRKINDIKDMFLSSSEIYCDRVAFIESRDNKTFSSVTYAQYKEDVLAFGTYLHGLGLSKKKIAIIGENCYYWCVAYMAVVCGLGVVVPLDKELPNEEIRNALNISECEAIIYSQSQERVRDICKDVPTMKHQLQMYNDDYIAAGKELMKTHSEYINLKVDTEQLSILLFTSGTTGNSKAVMLNHKNVISNLMSMCSMLYIDKKDVFLSFLPLHHTYQCTCGFLCPFYRGSAIAFSRGIRYIVDDLKATKTTILLCVPLLLENVYNKIWKGVEAKGKTELLNTIIKVNNVLKKVGLDLSKKLFKDIHATFGGHLRLFISGAAALDSKIAYGFKDLGINILQGYGLTECAPIVALDRDKKYNYSGVGLPLPGVDVQISQPDENGIGEITAQGPNVMMGYYRNQEETDKVLKDGVFYTGDLGFIDKDGFVHITGRKKNVIITKNGKNVFPEELEIYLSRSPYILESVITSKPNPKGDDIVVYAIVVVQNEEVESLIGQNYTQEQLIDLIDKEIQKVNALVQDYKRISGFEIKKEEFEKTTTKKIKRFKV